MAQQSGLVRLPQTLIAGGVAFGAIAAVRLEGALEGYLFAVRSADPVSLAAAGLVFVAVALGRLTVVGVQGGAT